MSTIFIIAAAGVAFFGGYIIGWKARKPAHPATAPGKELAYEAAREELKPLLEAKQREVDKYADESDAKSTAMREAVILLSELGEFPDEVLKTPFAEKVLDRIARAKTKLNL